MIAQQQQQMLQQQQQQVHAQQPQQPSQPTVNPNSSSKTPGAVGWSLDRAIALSFI